VTYTHRQAYWGTLPSPWETIYKNKTKFRTIPKVLFQGLIGDFN